MGILMPRPSAAHVLTKVLLEVGDGTSRAGGNSNTQLVNSGVASLIN